ncbi:MAG: hypothetical protein AB1726_09470 [Planctomycetota bacterium]
MAAPRDPVCIQCGEPVTDPPRIPLLPSGRPCPRCRDRFVESLPSLLPGSGEPVAGEAPPREEASASPPAGSPFLRSADEPA